jgi:hypothetical protein
MDLNKIAMDSYYNSKFGLTKEFKSDLNKIKIITKLLSRYYTSNKINTGLVLNHVVILINIFGIRTTNNMLFATTKSKFHGSIKSLLITIDSYIDNEYIDTSVKLDIILLNKIKGHMS